MAVPSVESDRGAGGRGGDCSKAGAVHDVIKSQTNEKNHGKN